MSEQKLVPVESTSAMDIAGAEVMHGDFNRNDAERVWRAMVSAAPIPEQVAPVAYLTSDGRALQFAESMRLLGQHPGDMTPLYASPIAQEVTQQAAKAEQALAEMEARKDAAYLERNQVVAALAKCFPSGVARTAIEGWSEDWHGCVYIDLPAGQVSWHFHDSQAHLFDALPPYAGKWDGHDTPEKYRRVAALPAAPLQTMDGTTRDEALEEAKEAAEILDSFIDNVSADGPYSAEATLTFIGQAKQCVDGAIRAMKSSPASGAAQEGDTRRDLTNSQIAAGAAVLCDCPDRRPIGRNAAIEVFDAMRGAASTDQKGSD